MKNTRNLFLASLLLLSGISFAQSSKTDNASGEITHPFNKGSAVISIATGFGVTYSYYGTYVSLPALSVAVDFGIMNHVGPGNIGVGGMVGFKTAYSRNSIYQARWNNYVIAARGTYHLTLLKNSKFDPYAGITAGIRINDYKDSYYNNNNPYTYRRVYPVAGVFVGAKYNFTKFFAGFVEAGYDISFVRIGFNLCM